MKRFALASACIIILAAALCACTGVDFDNLVISAEDAADVPAGEYTLVYSIKDYDKFDEKYGLTVSVTVYDQANRKVNVVNNRTITVEKGFVYSVVVVCAADVDGVIRSVNKAFTVIAEKKSPTVYFNAGDKVAARFEVGYGESLYLSSVPPVPDYYPPHDEGFDLEITSKKWVVGSAVSDVELTEAHLTGLTSDLNIYGFYTYRTVYKKVKIEFENNGGSETETIEVMYSSVIGKPVSPVKENCVFDGWYTDEKLTQLFDWKLNRSLRQSFTLYAKWLAATPSSVNDAFSYTKYTDDYGYDYYLIKHAGEASGETVLPAGKDNIPVRGLADFAFRNSRVGSVVIPARYDKGGYKAFENCGELTSVVFESGSLLTYIGMGAFAGCTRLERIALPDGVTDIQASAFEGCSSLREAALPASLSRINEKVFKDCSSLAGIAIPDSVTDIFQNAFDGCSALAEVSIGASSKLDFISKSAFGGCAFTEITLPYIFYKNGDKPFEGSGVTVSYHPELP